MLEIDVYEDHAEVVRYRGNESFVQIPEKYHGIPITVIRERSFFKSHVAEVLLPKTVRELGDSAFAMSKLRWIGCHSAIEERENGISSLCAQIIGDRCFEGTQLEDLVLAPSAGTSLALGEQSFARTSSLRNVVFSPDLWNLKLGKETFLNSSIETCILPTLPGVVYTVPERCFYRCESLRSVRFQSTTIEQEAFAKCSGLRHLSLLEGIAEILSKAFSECRNLKQLAIPESCVYVADNAIENSGISLLIVDEDNPSYFTIDGVLYSRTTGELVAYPSASRESKAENCNVEVPISDDIDRSIGRKGKTLLFEYTLYSNSVTIDRVFPHFSTIDIPAMITVNGNRYPIVEIGYGAIPCTCDELYIPQTVQESPYALAECIFLQRLTLPHDVWIDSATIPIHCVISRY